MACPEVENPKCGGDQENNREGLGLAVQREPVNPEAAVADLETKTQGNRVQRKRGRES
jgi:hypothetical protein